MLSSNATFSQVKEKTKSVGTIPKPSDTIRPDGDSTVVFEEKLTVPDTTIYHKYKAISPGSFTEFVDTALRLLHRYEPADKWGKWSFHLGNTGSSSTPIVYNPVRNVGVDHGLHQYDLYNLKYEDLDLFQVNRPFNDLYFSPMDGQTNFIVGARFHRMFSGNTGFHIDYNRISQLGYYSDQETKTTNLAISLSMFPESSRFGMLATLLTNNNSEKHNGGVSNKDFFQEEFFQIRENIPVYLSGASSRKEEKNYLLHTYINLGDTSDPKAKLQYLISYQNDYYRFSDEDVTGLEDFYGAFFVENRGIGSRYRSSNFAHDISVGFTPNPKFNFNSGIKYSKYNITHEQVKSDMNSLVLYGNIGLKISDHLSLSAKGQLGAADVNGTFLVEGDINLMPNKNYLRLSGGLSLYRHLPTNIQNAFYINEEEIYSTNFENPFGTVLRASLQAPKLGLSLGLRQLVENNTINWNESGFPTQTTDIYSSTVLSVSHLLKWKWLRFSNQGIFQLQSHDLFGLPKLRSMSALYYDNAVFNDNLHLQTGFDVSMIDGYKSIGYSPVNAVFYKTGISVNRYPKVDYFINGKIQWFRAFLKFENLAFILNDDINYQVKDYPLFDFKFRLGIRWIIRD